MTIKVKKTTNKLSKKTTAKRVKKKTNQSKTKKLIENKKTVAEKKLVRATGADCFWVNNGPILHDLRDLEKALDMMSEKMFTHHVSGLQNDFAEWVEHILKDKETAAALRKAKKLKTAHTVVVRHLKFYKLPGVS